MKFYKLPTEGTGFDFYQIYFFSQAFLRSYVSYNHRKVRLEQTLGSHPVYLPVQCRNIFIKAVLDKCWCNVFVTDYGVPPGPLISSHSHAVCLMEWTVYPGMASCFCKSQQNFPLQHTPQATMQNFWFSLHPSLHRRGRPGMSLVLRSHFTPGNQ